jgi:ribose transport system permease protein
MMSRLQATFDKRYLDAWFLAAVTVVMVVVFRVIEPSWLNSTTLQSIVTQNGPLAIVAMAMTFSIISRHIDLSPGSMLALASVVTGLVYRDEGSLALGLAAALAVCLASSLLNGLLVSRLGLSAIMVTLATYIWARGLALGFTNGDPIVVNTGLTSVVNHTVGGFTIVAPLVLVVYLAGGYVLSQTRFGRYTHAMGGDPVGARRAGVRVALNTTLIFGVMGVATWLASTIVVGQLESAQPYAAPTLELDAIIAVIIGGTRLAGGEGNVGRTLLGVAFISILNSGLLNLGLTDAYYQLYKGGALLAILSAQILLRRRVAADVRRRIEEERLLAEARGYA